MKPSYGDVTGEYLALRRDAAIVPDTHEIIWVRGPDAVAFLDGLLSQAINDIAPGATARSLLLSPQGKLRATLWVLRDGDDVGLVADRGVGDDVVTDLQRFKIRVDVAIDDAPTSLASLVGPHGDAALGRIGRTNDGTWSGDGEELVCPAPIGPGGHTRFFIGAAVAAALRGVPTAGSLAADAVRIEAGEPVMGIDIDERTIPQEAGPVDDAVSFTKGCYLGQELVARIDSRGHVNRHLRGLVISSNVLPPVGATASVGGTPVGTLTSIAESLDLRAPIALALIRREVDPGDEVGVEWNGGTTTAIVRSLPLIT